MKYDVLNKLNLEKDRDELLEEEAKLDKKLKNL